MDASGLCSVCKKAAGLEFITAKNISQEIERGLGCERLHACKKCRYVLIACVRDILNKIIKR